MNFLFFIKLGKLRVSLWALVFIGAVLYSDFSVFTFEVLFAATIHELGHLFAIKLFRVPVHSVTVMPYGAVISSDTALLPYKKEAVVALSGVIFNLITALILLCIFIFSKDMYTLFFLVCNLFLAAVNLIPVPTLDGARAMEALLFPHFGEEKTKGIMDTVYYFSFLSLVLLSLYVLNVTDGNFSLVILLVYTFICIYANRCEDKN